MGEHIRQTNIPLLCNISLSTHTHTVKIFWICQNQSFIRQTGSEYFLPVTKLVDPAAVSGCARWMDCMYPELTHPSTTQSTLQDKSAFSHSHTHPHTNSRWRPYREPACSSGTHTHIHTPMGPWSGAVWASVSVTLQTEAGEDQTTGLLVSRRHALPLGHSRPPAQSWCDSWDRQGVH